MNHKKVEDVTSDRREFLKHSVVAAAAVGTVAAASKAAYASQVEVPISEGYRETEHVKAFYDSARF